MPAAGLSGGHDVCHVNVDVGMTHIEPARDLRPMKPGADLPVFKAVAASVESDHEPADAEGPSDMIMAGYLGGHSTPVAIGILVLIIVSSAAAFAFGTWYKNKNK